MLLNCGVGEDSWESLGLQGDQTNQSERKSFLNIHWEDWCWSWNSNTLATWWEELTHWKRPWCWEGLRQEEKGTTEDEMVGWYHWLNGHEFEQALGVGNGQGSLACCSPWGHKESDTTEQLNWTESTSLGEQDRLASYIHVLGYIHSSEWCWWPSESRDAPCKAGFKGTKWQLWKTGLQRDHSWAFMFSLKFQVPP